MYLQDIQTTEKCLSYGKTDQERHQGRRITCIVQNCRSMPEHLIDQLRLFHTSLSK